MTLRHLSCPSVVGLLLIAVGCSSLDQNVQPILPTVATQHRVAPAALRRASGDRASDVRQVAFDEPIEVVQEDTLDLAPIPLSDAGTGSSVGPRTIQEVLNPPVVQAEEIVVETPTTLDLDMTGALAMAVGQNPRIAFATARYREAYAQLESAQSLWLPSIRAGASYNHHDGVYQTSSSSVINKSRSSLQMGMGVNAVGAGSPTEPGVLAEFHTSDAFFQPKIASHGAAARDAAASATTNDTLLATAIAYLDLLRTTQQLRISEETHANAKKLADLTAAFARTGEGSHADADRAKTELVKRQIETSRSQEKSRVASARLSEVLSLDPSLEVMPQEPTIVPIDLIPHDSQAGDLVATALENRPELAEAQYLVCEAVYRYRREKYAPLLPSVLLGVSQGNFGGGQGSIVDNDHRRFDYVAAIYWEIRNLGFGERSKRNETYARYDQTRALQMSVMDRVAREVVEAHTQVKSRKEQIEIAKSGVQSATDSYEKNLVRIREGQGLPLEVLQSLQALDGAQREYLQTLADYNEAQFRLQRALGWPIQ